MQYCPPVLFKTISEVSRGHLTSVHIRIAQIIMYKLSLCLCILPQINRSDIQEKIVKW